MKKSLYLIVLVLVGVMFMTGCEYDFIYHPADPIVTPDPIDPDNPPDPNLIKFSTQIVPIFTTGNRCTSCHGDGGTRPILTASKAYGEITSLGLVNVADPSSSKIYTYVKTGTSTHVWKKYSDTQADLVLQWITEGAKNN